MTPFPEGLLPDALCVDADPNMFFPTKGDNATDAKALCGQCPIVDECREFAIVELADDAADVGIWGGTSPRERAAERMRRGTAPSRRWHSDVLQPCGTAAAYRRHVRKRETPCGPCREANSQYKALQVTEDQRRRKAELERRRRSAA